jgi:hypothetical protein
VHHGNGAFWLILLIMAALVLGPAIFFTLRGDREAARPEDSLPPAGPEH